MISTSIRARVRALVNPDAWLLLGLGALLFASRAPVSPLQVLHLPLLLAMIQMAGFMFVVAGLQIMLSILVWPEIQLGDLLGGLRRGSMPHALALLGLLLFNGLSMIAFVLWVGWTFGASLGVA